MILNSLPKLSDETTAHMLDFLHELITAFENYYGPQLRRYYDSDPPDQYDLFEDNHDDGDIPF